VTTELIFTAWFNCKFYSLGWTLSIKVNHKSHYASVCRFVHCHCHSRFCISDRGGDDFYVGC
jgi:hypothetical protein